MSATPIDELRMSLDATGHLVAGVRAEQWSQPTPCTRWTVRQLVNHLVAGNRLFAGILSGQPLPPPEQRRQSADQLGDDPGTAYRASASDLVAAFGRPGVLQQKFTVPVGPVPGIAALHLRVVEAIVHGWDLAHALPRAGSSTAGILALASSETRHTRSHFPFPRTRSSPSSGPAI